MNVALEQTNNADERQAGEQPRYFVAWGLLAFLASWGVIIFVDSAFRMRIYDHYEYLADAFLHGRLYLVNFPPDMVDQVFYQGRSYVPFGPFPALVTMPFVLLFGPDLHTTIITWPLSVLNGGLLWRIFAHMGLVARVRWWLLALFFVGSVYSFVMVTEGAWFLAQVVTVALLLAAILIVLRKPLAEISRPEWLAIGLLLAAAFLSRSTTIFAALFFVVLLILTARHDGWPRPAYLWPLAMLGLGLGLGGLIFCAYNYARFGSITETGYAMAYINSAQLIASMKEGLFSLQHLPTNFYYMFLAGLNPYPSASAPVLQFPWFVPSPLGMSILLTTPTLVYIVRPRFSNPLVPACWAAIIPTAFTLLLYYGTGQIQFGYRYTLDFMPFALLLLALAFHDNFSRLVRVLIIIGICICLWGNATINLVWYD